MEKMTPGKLLTLAKKKKNDEHYTQIGDVERELGNYQHHFRDKIVYCNCDDPTTSAFSQYFQNLYTHLGLKGLFTTCYQSRQGDQKSQGEKGHGLMLKYSPPRRTKKDGDVFKPPDPKILKGDGDFRSPECLKILEKADIVVTNPPFSLLREFIATLMEYEKKFLILVPQNAVKYKEVFPLIHAEKIWMGVNNGGCKWFEVSLDYEIKTAARRRMEYDEQGNPIRQFHSRGDVNWLTNLDHARRHEEPVCWMSYDKNPDLYPHYDNYDAIEVGRVENIPIDYSGLMGVPITYLAKHNPDHFRIIGLDRPLVQSQTGKVRCFYLNGKELYSRIVIQRRK